jgi:hypothetical protein
MLWEYSLITWGSLPRGANNAMGIERFIHARCGQLYWKLWSREWINYESENVTPPIRDYFIKSWLNKKGLGRIHLMDR